MPELTSSDLLYSIVNKPYLMIRNYDTKIVRDFFPALAIPSAPPGRLALSPDGTTLACMASAGAYLYLIDVATAVITLIGDPPDYRVYGGEFSPDGSLFVCTGGSSTRIDIYETTNWTKIPDPALLPYASGYDVAFSPDGSMVAIVCTSTAGRAGVLIYDTSDWSQVVDLTITYQYTYTSCDWSPDGTRLIVGQNNTAPTMFDTSDWSTVVHSMTKNGAKSVRYNPSGTKVLYDTGGDLMWIYDVVSDSELICVAPPTAINITNDDSAGRWVNDDLLVAFVSGVPGIRYWYSDGQLAHYDSSVYRAYVGLHGIGDAYEINGTIDESLVADSWIATAYELETGLFLGSTEFTGTSFTISVFKATACTVTVSAKQGDSWQASNANVSVGDKVFPTDPITTPYYYIATSGGVTGASEPTWPVTVNGTVVDGGVTWQRVERLIQPVTQSPLVPTVVV